jgi:phage shock protein A
MKTGRLIVLLVIIAAVGLLIWRFVPGLRQKATDAYRRYGGWTEEARRADPVGFIEYAEKELKDDLQSLEDTRLRMAEAAETVASELERARVLLDSAGELAEQFRQAYRQAEAQGGYPVEVAGAEYTRDELIEQVRLVLLQQASYEAIIADFEAATGTVADKQQQLVTQITATKAALSSLPAKKEIARLNELTGRTEELFQKVDEVIGQNETVLAASPVRTVEELIQEREATSEAAEGVDAEAFLEGGQ